MQLNMPGPSIYWNNCHLNRLCFVFFFLVSQENLNIKFSKSKHKFPHQLIIKNAWSVQNIKGCWRETQPAHRWSLMQSHHTDNTRRLLKFSDQWQFLMILSSSKESFYVFNYAIRNRTKMRNSWKGLERKTSTNFVPSLWKDSDRPRSLPLSMPMVGAMGCSEQEGEIQ